MYRSFNGSFHYSRPQLHMNIRNALHYFLNIQPKFKVQSCSTTFFNIMFTIAMCVFSHYDLFVGCMHLVWFMIYPFLFMFWLDLCWHILCWRYIGFYAHDNVLTFEIIDVPMTPHTLREKWSYYNKWHDAITKPKPLLSSNIVGKMLQQILSST
jgi:hypothetical protein